MSETSSCIKAVKLFATSLGNHFMLEIAQIFTEGFRSNGVSVDLAIDEVPSKIRKKDLLQIIVAPHEFYPLFLEKKVSQFEILKLTQNTYLLNVEQPGSMWFEIAYQPSRYAKGVFDINKQGVEEFRKRGVSALHTPLGYESCFEAETDDNISKSIDILFIGSHSPRREMFLSTNADFFSKYKCRFIMTRVDKPNSTNTPGFYAGQQRNKLLKSSKILINIHFADRTYFEWHRILMAIANNCLIVSETSDYTEPLINQEHLVFTEIEKITSVCNYYIDNEDKRIKLTEQAYDFVTKNYASSQICSSLLSKIQTTDWLNLAKATYSPAFETNNNSNIPTNSIYPQTTDIQANDSILEVINNVDEINFKNATENCLNGCFDAVNDSNALSHEVSRADSIKISGWAILADESKSANLVVITYGDDNSLVGIATVNYKRLDVAEALSNPAYENSGWKATFYASVLPGDKVLLKAWVYNSERKEATCLERTHEIVVSN